MVISFLTILSDRHSGHDMTTTRQRRKPPFSRAPKILPDRIVSEAGSAFSELAWTEAAYRTLLRLTPDQVFRIKLRLDGSVSVIDDRSRIQIAADGLARPRTEPDTESLSDGPTKSLCMELARRGRELRDELRHTGGVRTIELEINHNGQTTYHEVRVAASLSRELLAVVHNGQTTYREIGDPANPTEELLALVRDVTSLKEARAIMATSQGEVIHLNELFREESSLRAESEEILENAFAKLTRLLDDTINAIQMIVQKKHPPTARHQARVAQLACAIGREMGLDKTQVDIIGLAALLHDLGKVFIPDITLNKPGKLSQEEFVGVRDSADTEFQILKTIDLFCPIADIVHQHHERMNGSGYPLGLRGDDILMEARIIGVADVVEAMLSDRPYRPALPVDAAIREVAAGRGILYDADAVDACISLLTEGNFQFDADAGLSA